MYDRTVRRRRAVLIAFVVLSLFLLTVFFGESTGGPLHAVQRGAMSVLSPIQSGADRALKPARDLFGWIGDTIDAKDERDQLRAEREALRGQVAELQAERQQLKALQGLTRLNTNSGLEQYAPLPARVISQSPSLFYSAITIDKGSDDGIRVDQPVIASGGLVGRVSTVTGGAARVTLITDEAFAANGRTLTTDVPGTIAPSLGSQGDMTMTIVGSGGSDVRRGEVVVTTGTTDPATPSLYPPNIPIGTISRIEDPGNRLDRDIHLRPEADLTRLQIVEVLTKPSAPPLQTDGDNP